MSLIWCDKFRWFEFEPSLLGLVVRAFTNRISNANKDKGMNASFHSMLNRSCFNHIQLSHTYMWRQSTPIIYCGTEKAKQVPILSLHPTVLLAKKWHVLCRVSPIGTNRHHSVVDPVYWNTNVKESTTTYYISSDHHLAYTRTGVVAADGDQHGALGEILCWMFSCHTSTPWSSGDNLGLRCVPSLLFDQSELGLN